MNHYVAIVLWQAQHGDGAESLYSEEIHLLQASSLAQAEQQLHTRLTAQQTSYRNAAGEQVTWTVRQVLDIQPFLADATTDAVYCRHFRNWAAYQAFEPLLDGSL